MFEPRTGCPNLGHTTLISYITFYSLSTGWPVKHGRVLLVPCIKSLAQCTPLYNVHVYTGQVTFSKVQEKHDHVKPCIKTQTRWQNNISECKQIYSRTTKGRRRRSQYFVSLDIFPVVLINFLLPQLLVLEGGGVRLPLHPPLPSELF